VYTVAAARAGFKGGGREPGLCGAARSWPNTDRQRPIREHTMSARFDPEQKPKIDKGALVQNVGSYAVYML
jgi:hypothetical protein